MGMRGAGELACWGVGSRSEGSAMSGTSSDPALASTPSSSREAREAPPALLPEVPWPPGWGI